jgi:hypothetical protein
MNLEKGDSLDIKMVEDRSLRIAVGQDGDWYLDPSEIEWVTKNKNEHNNLKRVVMTFQIGIE